MNCETLELIVREFVDGELAVEELVGALVGS
jgi:hypothetical protein